MRISAQVQNSQGENTVMLRTGNNAHGLRIAARPTGQGSSVSGGELLFLALATCYCNDIYREAAKLNIKIESVEVEVTGDFGGEGERATNVTYHAKVKSPSERGRCPRADAAHRQGRRDSEHRAHGHSRCAERNSGRRQLADAGQLHVIGAHRCG